MVRPLSCDPGKAERARTPRVIGTHLLVPKARGVGGPIPSVGGFTSGVGLFRGLIAGPLLAPLPIPAGPPSFQYPRPPPPGGGLPPPPVPGFPPPPAPPRGWPRA